MELAKYVNNSMFLHWGEEYTWEWETEEGRELIICTIDSIFFWIEFISFVNTIYIKPRQFHIHNRIALSFLTFWSTCASKKFKECLISWIEDATSPLERIRQNNKIILLDCEFRLHIGIILGYGNNILICSFLVIDRI